MIGKIIGSQTVCLISEHVNVLIRRDSYADYRGYDLSGLRPE